jgi:hypothetical protein
MSILSMSRVSLLALSLFGAACSDSSTGPAPAPVTTIQIAAPAFAVYELDAVNFSATVRDAQGNPIPGAPVTWSVSDTTRAELGANGIVTALKAGAVTITARSGATTASYNLTIARLVVQQVQVLPGELTLSNGEVTPVGVKVEGQGGRLVIGRLVQITSDDPSIATIDPSGRVRAVNAGVTTIRATADGVSGTARVIVRAANAKFALRNNGSARLPMLVASDSVTWDGRRELHELWMESGALELSGTSTARYELEIKYAEYRVTMVNGQKRMDLLILQREYDRGIVSYDSRGDLQLTSEYISPLAHTAAAISGGLQMHFRIPGTDDYLDLFFRREPD